MRSACRCSSLLLASDEPLKSATYVALSEHPLILLLSFITPNGSTEKKYNYIHKIQKYIHKTKHKNRLQAKITVHTLRKKSLCMSSLLSVDSPTDFEAATTTLSILGKALVCIAFSVVYVHSSELFPTEVRNVGVGTASMCARVSSLAASFVGGPLVNLSVSRCICK